MNGSFAKVGSRGFLKYWRKYVSLPVRSWSISGWKNWFNDAQVLDMITSGCHVASFSTSAIACVQNAPDVSINGTSDFFDANVVNWLVRFGAVASWLSWSTTFRAVPLDANA